MATINIILFYKILYKIYKNYCIKPPPPKSANIFPGNEGGLFFSPKLYKIPECAK